MPGLRTYLLICSALRATAPALAKDDLLEVLAQ